MIGARRRSLPRHPPDDRGPAPLEARRDQGAREDRPRRLRLLDGHAHAHRGRHEEARVDPPGPRRGRAPRPRRGRPRGAGRRRGRVPPRADGREPHPQARPHRPAHPGRDRQRVLGRDPAPRAPVAREADAEPRPTRSTRGSSRPPGARSPTGSSACAATPPASSPRGSPPSARTWPCTAASASRARTAAPPCSGSVYADNETNYCARCQTGGRLLADRALSRLLRADWPRTLEELEERRSAHGPDRTEEERP